MVVGFVCLLDWTTRDPDFWPEVILGVSVRVFLDEVNI